MAAPEITEETLPRGTERILLVEDEPQLRSTGKRILERLGYEVMLAADGREALEVLDAAEHPADLVVSDIVMPHMNGYQLHDALQRDYEPVKFLFTTGYAGEEAKSSDEPYAHVPLLKKPWTLTELARGVRAVLDER